MLNDISYIHHFVGIFEKNQHSFMITTMNFSTAIFSSEYNLK